MCDGKMGLRKNCGSILKLRFADPEGNRIFANFRENIGPAPITHPLPAVSIKWLNVRRKVAVAYLKGRISCHNVVSEHMPSGPCCC